jgi:hypothetical protein
MTINLSTFLGTTFQGNTGIQGAQGTQGVGSQGAQGIVGAGSQGSSGSQGASGSQGIQGLSNQGVQGTIGAQGTQGVQGLSNQGTSGIQGAQGTQGFTGTQGTQGIIGAGSQGAQGTQGFSPVGIPSSTNTTLVAADAGKFTIIDGNVTINSSTGFSVGDMCTIYNSGTTTRTITATGVTLRWAGTSATGNRQLSQKGLGNVLCVASNDYVISGAGLT